MSTVACIGVDVGGTNSDAVVMSLAASEVGHDKVLGSAKVATSADITSGLEKVIQKAIEKCSASNHDDVQVRHISIGKYACQFLISLRYVLPHAIHICSIFIFI